MSSGQRRLKQVVSLLLACVFVITALPSYAKEFKDVSATHWAKTYIDKMSEVGVIAGHADGTFEPKGNVTYIQTLAFVSRLFNLNNSEKTSAKTKYMFLLSELKVTQDWEREAVAICLDKGIVSEDELRKLSSTLKKPAKKVDVAVFLARGLGLEQEANEKAKTGIILPFQDTELIDNSRIKYVWALYDKKIVQGDDKKCFNPNNNVTRAEMATMLSKGYDYLEDNPTKSTEPTVSTPSMDSLETVEGTINSLYLESKTPFVMVTDKDEVNIAFTVSEEDSDIYIDDKPANMKDLAVGQKVEVKTKKNDKTIVALYAESIKEEYTGIIKYLYSSTYKLTLEYEENKKTYTKEFEVDKDADIYLDDKSVYLEDLKEGDEVELKTKNNKISEIDGVSKLREIEGTLVEIDKEGSKYYLTVVDSKDKPYEYLVGKDAYITRNGKKANIEDLKIKDGIDIKVEYDEITDIDAKVVKREIKGYITKVITGLKDTEITVKDIDTKKDETFYLGKDAYIKVDNKIASSYDIKPRHYVELVTEGDEIVELYADSRSVETNITGKIETIDYRREIMVIVSTSINLEEDLYGEEIIVYLDDNTTIVDGKFRTLYFADLYRGDLVNIKGSYDGSSFIANRIILEK